MNAEDIHQFFGQFEHAQAEHKIDAVDIWNMDESGFRAEVGCDQWVIIPVVKDQSQSQNKRVSVTRSIGHYSPTRPKSLTVISER